MTFWKNSRPFYIFLVFNLIFIIGLSFYIWTNGQPWLHPFLNRLGISYSYNAVKLPQEASLLQDSESGYFYGTGTLIKKNNNYLDIDFGKDGRKTLFVYLDKIPLFMSNNQEYKPEERQTVYQQLEDGAKVAVAFDSQMIITFLNILK